MLTRAEALSRIKSRLTITDAYGHAYESVANYLHKLSEMTDEELFREAVAIDPSLSAPRAHENNKTTTQ